MYLTGSEYRIRNAEVIVDHTVEIYSPKKEKEIS